MPSSSHRKTLIVKEVIDVDEFHKRYEDPDGLIQCSSAQEFRKTWRDAHRDNHDRVGRSRSAVTEGSRQTSSQRDVQSESAGPMPITGGTARGNQPAQEVPQQAAQRHAQANEDRVSILEPSIQQAMSQKRAISSTSDSTSKRPRIHLQSAPPRPPSARPMPLFSGSDAHPFLSSSGFNAVQSQSSRHPSPELPLFEDIAIDEYEPPVILSRSNSKMECTTPSPPDPMILDDKPQQSIPKNTLKRPRQSPSPNWKHFKHGSTIKRSPSMTPVTNGVEVIELFSDEDTHPAPERPSKRSKFTQSRCILSRSNSPIEFSSDSEISEDDWDHPGLSLDDPNVWLPIQSNVNKLDLSEPQDHASEGRLECYSQHRDKNKDEDDAAALYRFEDLSISPSLTQYRRPDTSRWLSPPLPPGPYLYVWDKLRLAENVRWRPRPRPVIMQTPLKIITRSKDADFNFHKLKVASSFKQSPGTINAIEQSEGYTVIGSACVGGLADIADETPSPYNRPGSLIVESDGNLEFLHAHSVSRRDQTKYYTINDVKFHPISNSFASTGEDKKFRIWTLHENPETGESKWKVDVKYDYAYVPHALAFRPGSNILAVAEKKVRIYDLSEETIPEPHCFQLHDKLSRHIIGSMTWGHESTADHLFVSSEPLMAAFTGAHKVYDFQTQNISYQLDAEEAGDVIAVDSSGSTLALCTQAEVNRHILRLYDIRRRVRKAIASLDLVPFPSRDFKDFEGEMNVAAFSPDEFYLALARNDNCCHVYDRRMLGKNGIDPLFKYEHYGESKAVSRNELYGVVHAQWFQSPSTRRTCLVTGGEDGCVRMWDPSTGIGDPGDSENGKVIAEVNYDVSQFSIGDPFAGEHRLVVGDASGEVTIFDHLCV